MRFLILVIDDTSISATADEMKHINAFNDKLHENGQFILACGLADPSNSILIDNRNGKNKVEHHPLFPNKEQFSGFWVIQANDLDQAKELALGGSNACNRKVELRPILEKRNPPPKQWVSFCTN